MTRKTPDSVEERFSEPPSDFDSSHGFRSAQPTLVDDRPSVSSLPPVRKDRVLLTVLSGPAEGTVAQMSKPDITLGRSHDADVVIPDPSLSRIHARIRSTLGKNGTMYLLEDAGSTNGTFLGTDRIRRHPRELTDGARIGLGRRTFVRFSLQDPLEEQAVLRVHDSALRDALTGVHNRSVFEDRLRSETAFSERHQRPLVLMMIDVDHFKAFNDEHGHQAGDAALKLVAETMSRQLRVEDLLARYGGEEFAVLMRDVSPDRATRVAERVRRSVERHSLSWKGESLSMSVSVGLAHLSGTRRATSSDLVRCADAALYEAKFAGRNRVVDGGDATPATNS